MSSVFPFLVLFSIGKRKSWGIPSLAWNRKYLSCLWNAAPSEGVQSHTISALQSVYSKTQPHVRLPLQQYVSAGKALLGLNDLMEEERDWKRKRKGEKGEKEKKKMKCGGDRATWWQRARGRTSSEVQAEPRMDYIAKGLAETLQALHKKPHLELSLAFIGLWTWSCSQADGHWLQHCGNCAVICAVIPELLRLHLVFQYLQITLCDWCCFTALCVKETWYSQPGLWTSPASPGQLWNQLPFLCRCGQQCVRQTGLYCQHGNFPPLSGVFNRLVSLRAVPYCCTFLLRI